MKKQLLQVDSYDEKKKNQTKQKRSYFLRFCAWYWVLFSLSIRPSYGARGEEILDGGGGRGRRERKAWHKTIQQIVWHIQNLDVAVIG